MLPKKMPKEVQGQTMEAWEMMGGISGEIDIVLKVEVAWRDGYGD